MIEKLENTNLEIARRIRSVFQASYKVEADLLGAKDFPPLKRPIERFVNTATQFYGYIIDGELAGVVEMESTPEVTDVNSLVVHPRFFRKGVGKALMEYVIQTFASERYIVETGVENGPATKLYLKLGFREVDQWDTEIGIRKVKFEMR